ncbi:hypothetical protein BMH28_10750 [Leucobacter sp. OLCS4]|uniref:copper homeostasis protein CutC n=1 Tax=Leucobacter sp. OLCS4 TaxID=1914918 RepID=UPI000C1A0E75|nr:copper homeostasis protein CutC [Leucobacter sp. OLCS4]PII99508.1 hypothetical protein BMH28_10750 [Leucobacter sp. OLCS4]
MNTAAETPAPGRLAVEIVAQDLDGVRIALAEGADRVELCTALVTGGLTPSAALIESAAELARDAGREGFVHVLIRSRPGDFVYSAEELGLMRRDAAHAVRLGASGAVVGALDLSTDPVAALAALAELGVARVLTSGGAARVSEGMSVLRALAAAGTGVQIMAGGGATPGDAAALRAAGADALHLSARRTLTGGPTGPGGGDSSYDATDAGIVRAAVAAARA